MSYMKRIILILLGLYILFCPFIPVFFDESMREELKAAVFLSLIMALSFMPIVYVFLDLIDDD